MHYKVIARKFRPQVFEDVVGQTHVTRVIKNAIEMERLPHAFVFSGPRGVGKTSVARILAKAINCREGISGTPCNRCSLGEEITTSRAVDVFEIDAAVAVENRHLVGFAAERVVGDGNVVGNDEVEILLLKLAPGVVDEVVGFGGKPNAERRAGDRAQNVRRSAKFHGPQVVNLLLLPRDGLFGTVIADSGAHDEDVSVP